MILSAIPKQFTLNDHGQVFYQSNSTNPLPGVMIGRVTKGTSVLQPDVELLAEFDCGAEDRAQVAEFLSTWLKAYIYTTLQPLFNLIQFEQEPASQPQTKAEIETEANSQAVEPESPPPETAATETATTETAAPETAAAEASQAATAEPESQQTAPKIPDCVQSILLKVFEGMGISPRADNESAIAQLDADMRKILRDKKLRMGPVLLFLPELNKPASIRLRGLLWSLFHDQPLPAPLPKDGAMSAVVAVAAAGGASSSAPGSAPASDAPTATGNDPVKAVNSVDGVDVVDLAAKPAPNPEFYRAIGYPIYGPRAIRIDMLDRVINSIYDGAKDGKFQAKHTMAEWIGCPIADLYAILTALGHKRIENSAPQISPQEIPQEKQLENQQANHQIAANADSANVEAAPAENVPITAPISVAVSVAAPASPPRQMSLFDEPVPAPSPTESPESTSPDRNGADRTADGAKSNRANSPLDRAKKTAPAKPQLDFFILRRGKAYAPARAAGATHRDGRNQKHGGPFNGKNRHGAHSPAHDKMAAETTGGEAQSLDSRPSKKFSKPDAFPPERYPAKGQKFDRKARDGAEGDSGQNHQGHEGNKGDFKGKSGGKFGGKGGDRSENRAHKDRDFATKKPERSDRKPDSSHKKSEPRIYTAEAATHDNPFAVLKGLKI